MPRFDILIKRCDSSDAAAVYDVYRSLQKKIFSVERVVFKKAENILLVDCPVVIVCSSP